MYHATFVWSWIANVTCFAFVLFCFVLFFCFVLTTRAIQVELKAISSRLQVPIVLCELSYAILSVLTVALGFSRPDDGQGGYRRGRSQGIRRRQCVLDAGWPMRQHHRVGTCSEQLGFCAGFTLRAVGSSVQLNVSLSVLCGQEYTYKLCFFDSVKQNTIYLGRYKGWAEAKGGKDYTTQLYEKGQMCPGNEWYAARATRANCGQLITYFVAHAIETGGLPRCTSSAAQAPGLSKWRSLNGALISWTSRPRQPAPQHTSTRRSHI